MRMVNLLDTASPYEKVKEFKVYGTMITGIYNPIFVSVYSYVGALKDAVDPCLRSPWGKIL
jgi:hypothetical protein